MNIEQEKINKINDDLRNAIYSQPKLIKIILENIKDQLPEVIDNLTANNIQKVYITGCGDSYFAGIASELAFRHFAGVDVQPVEPLNFSRYISPYLNSGSLLIAISNSGKVSRTIEATQRANKRIETLAITDAPDAGLAKSSKRTLYPHIPYLPSGGAGTRSYLASLICLFSISLYMGKQRGHLSEKEYIKYWSIIEGMGDLISRTLDYSQQIIKKFAMDLTGDKVFYLGGGPNYATAMFGAAKIMEALSIDGIAVELEEWAHLQFHTTFEGTNYILIAPPGDSYDRAIEQIRGIKDSGGYVAAIIDHNDNLISELADIIIPVESPYLEIFSPLVYSIPTQLLAVYLADSRNIAMKMRLDDNRKEINFRQIFNSSIKE